jgi:sugar phosphate isomerase/epimerase
MNPMTHSTPTFSVFTKPWKSDSLQALGRHVKAMGFDAIELPVRDGYQVEPQHIARDLPSAQKMLAEQGVAIASLATAPTPEAIRVCGQLRIPIIRTMAPIDADGYCATEARTQQQFSQLLPSLRDAGVKLGVQNHNGRFVCNAMGLRRLIEPLDPAWIGAIWDAAHNALNGEEAELALDIIWDRLCMVNLKNAFWMRTNGPEAEVAAWQVYWTSGRQGLASWPRVVGILQRRGYTGAVCLTAEYTAEEAVDRLIREDIVFAKSLFGSST